ncbi:transposase [Streptomyces sp. NBC_01537]|uniref:transposase n=1 Tax=Streptomyces sp. NBC_01537 TaxID=2903896 RepID=UPI003870DE40
MSRSWRTSSRPTGSRHATQLNFANDVAELHKLRYVVEQAFALLHQFKRLAIRWERRLELHDAFASLACSLICWRHLKKAHP